MCFVIIMPNIGALNLDLLLTMQLVNSIFRKMRIMCFKYILKRIIPESF